MSVIPQYRGVLRLRFCDGLDARREIASTRDAAAEGLPALLARCGRPKAGKPAGRAPLPLHEFTADAADNDALDDRAMAREITSSDALGADPLLDADRIIRHIWGLNNDKALNLSG